MKNSPIRKRFILTVVIYTVLILALWFGYYLIAYRSVSSSAAENAELTAERLLDQISAEFAQMRSVTEIIAASTFVQDFMMTDTVETFYEHSGTVAEIIRNAAFSATATDGLVTIDSSGVFYRFHGSLSNTACEILHHTFMDKGVSYTVMELDGISFFCHSAPIITTTGQTPQRVGTVVILSNLSRKRTILADNALVGVDTAVIQDEVILLSNNNGLEGTNAHELDSSYGLVLHREIVNTNLSVAAAVGSDELFPNRSGFIATSAILLATLLIAIIILYRYLSHSIIRPMASVVSGVASLDGELKGRLFEMPVLGRPDFESLVIAINGMLDRTEQYNNELLNERQKSFDSELQKRDMQIGLLTSQIDAHFVVNTIASIRTLSAQGENEKAARMAEGLAQVIKHRHSGDELRNIFVELGMIEEYLAIMHIRYENRFSVDYDVSDELVEFNIPGLVLQPVVENVLTHGIHSKDSKITLKILGYITDDAVFIEVYDDGMGIQKDKLEMLQKTLEIGEISTIPEPGLSGIALSNIQKRIKLQCGENFGLFISSVPNEGTTVTIKLPKLKS